MGGNSLGPARGEEGVGKRQTLLPFSCDLSEYSTLTCKMEVIKMEQ